MAVVLSTSMKLGTVQTRNVEAVLSAILASAKDNVYAFTPELRFVFVNEGGARIYGLTPDQVVGRTWDEILPLQHTDRERAFVARVVATRQPLRDELLFDGADGPRYYDYFLTPVLDARGEVELIVSIGRDITERKNAELERVRLHEAERRANARAEILARVSDTFARARLDLNSILSAVAQEVATTLGDGCGILFLSDDGETLYQVTHRMNDPEAHALYGEAVAQARFPKGEGFTGRVLSADGPLLIPQLTKEQVVQGSTPPYRRFFERFPFYSLLGMPLRAEGKLLGLISAVRLTPGCPYVTEDLHLLEDIAQRASWAIANARQHEALEAERRRLLRLQEIAAALSVTRTPQEVATVAIRHGLAALDAPHGGLWVPGKEEGVLEMAGARGYSADTLRQFGRLSLKSAARGPVVESFLSGEAIFIESAAEFERRYPEMKAATPHILSAFAAVCVPLQTEHQSVGVLNFSFDRSRVFSPEERAFLGIIARLCAQSLERSRLYEAEQAARAQAEAQRAWLHRLFEQLPAAVVVLTGPDLLCTLANQASQRLIGFRPLLGRPLRETMPGLEGQGLFEALERVLRTAEPHVELEVPVRYSYGTGGEHREGFFDVFYHPLYDASGRVEAVVGFTMEVTEQVRARKRVEEVATEREKVLRELEVERQRLAAVLQEAQAASRAKDEFLAMLGHELRNPLAPILTALQLMELRAGGALGKERAVIERQIHHVVRLVDDLLDVSRITRQKVELRKRPLVLSEIVARAAEMGSPLLEERRHRLTLQVAPGFVVEADERRLTQVVSNLLNNAAKYTEPGGHIEVSAQEHASGVALRVRDTGTGIGPELLPRVFELFVQGERTVDRAQGGLGLGLAIVKSLVELHGGQVRAESQGHGQGSTFTVWLPLAARRPMKASEEGSSPPPTAVPRKAAARRILLVDDNRDAVEALAEGLEAFGYAVTVALDGPQGLEAATRQRPDLAVLDIGLPVMDGYELARRLRELSGMGSVPLIALTGYGTQKDRDRTQEVGFNFHLVKPVDLFVLKGLLQQYLGSSATIENP